MSLAPRDIKHIVDALNESDWDTANIVVGDVSIAVSRGGVPPLAAAPAAVPVAAVASPAPEAAAPQPQRAVAPAAPAAPAQAEVAGGVVIESPSVGVFWTTPEPGAAPFVEVGSTVQPGDTLCIVEIMKLMNNVTAEIAGTVAAVHLENAAAVEFGTPLFTIIPEV